jgi:hypothetical protein
MRFISDMYAKGIYVSQDLEKARVWKLMSEKAKHNFPDVMQYFT